jgi:hypothetical protein
MRRGELKRPISLSDRQNNYASHRTRGHFDRLSLLWSPESLRTCHRVSWLNRYLSRTGIECRPVHQPDWDFRTVPQFPTRQRWTASRSLQFTPDTHCTGGLVSSRSVLIAPTGKRTHDSSQVHPVVQSLYPLSYLSYYIYILTKSFHYIYT